MYKGTHKSMKFNNSYKKRLCGQQVCDAVKKN